MTKLRIGVIGAGYFGRFHTLKVAGNPAPSCPACSTPIPAAPPWSPRRQRRNRRHHREPDRGLGCDRDRRPAEAISTSPRGVGSRPPRAGGKADRRDAGTGDALAALAAAKARCCRSGICCATPPNTRLFQNASPGRSTSRPPASRPTSPAARCFGDPRSDDPRPRSRAVAGSLRNRHRRRDGCRGVLDSEDIANARVRFKNGCVATITASRISLKTSARCGYSPKRVIYPPISAPARW